MQPPASTEATDYGQSVELPDGRRLAYAEYGAPDGTPVVFCHGTPGSRVSGSVARDTKASVGARVLAPDRPGMGRSDPDPGRTFADWSDDVAALADEVGVDEYAVVGFSGGGPYALACAAHAPERVSRCAVVSGVPPRGVATADRQRFDRALNAVARWSRHLARPFTWAMRRVVADADAFTDVVGEPKDGDLADPRLGETGRIMLTDFREGVRQGSAAVATDYAVLAGDWDFDLGGVSVPTRVFHGSDDDRVPLAAGKHVAREVPEARLTVYDGAGHFRPVIEQVADVYGWAATAGDPDADRAREAAVDD
ncbi:alpha/beta fold hydrolase [Halobacterium yunchengense]|uniref:alpha/beta fold hydrolase n=1 Tax=Halobacterium yunchengense TaxID=3108497 RepID=UPI00300B5EA4